MSHMVSHTGPVSRLGEHRVFRGDGSMDVKMFLFVFEKVLTKGAEAAQKAKEIVLYFKGGG